jgi:protein involved in polysaccharide export with SLBB domain
MSGRCRTGILTCLVFALGACGAPFRDYWAGEIDAGLDVQTLEMAGTKRAPYRIQAGDTLSIKFYRNPELDTELVVRPDGMISLPLVDDEIAMGRTPQALGDAIEARYVGELAVPQVTVIVTEFGGQRVWVGGDVQTPGELELTPGLTLLASVQKAGGFLNSARVDQVILIRRGLDGKPLGRSIDLTDVYGGQHPEDDVLLEPFDIVVVPRSAVGNVNTFVELYITRNIPGGSFWAAFLNF